MSDGSIPVAARQRAPRWLNARLVGGLVLVFASVLAGVRLVGAADRYSTVLVARHALLPGEQLTAADVTVGRARLYGRAHDYLTAAGSLPAGYVVTRPVGAGELVPAAAVAPGGSAPTDLLVTVPVDPGHLPPDLADGDVVDLYATPHEGSSTVPGTPSLVLADAAVRTVDSGAHSFAASDSTIDVVLAVPPTAVPTVVRAAEIGGLDVVRVPIAAPAG